MKPTTHYQQIPLDLGVRSAFGRSDYLITPENKDAVTWIDAWPNWPAPALFLVGPAASGKSHLAAVWREKTKAEKISGEMLLDQSADDICKCADNLLFDGIDPWLGLREAEETLFHIYNICKEQKRKILMTSRMPPSQVQFALADLSSRFRAAPVATIDPPGDVLLASILIKLFNDRQLSVNEDVIQYVLPRMERSFSAAHGLVERADALALANKQKISIPLMRRILSEHTD